MAATTMPAMTWVDDSGTPASPVGDGTVINNSQLQTLIGKINQMFAGGAGFETFTFGGLVVAEGLGTHSVVSAGTGIQRFVIGNTTAGTGNAAALDLHTDLGIVAELVMTSSTFTGNPNTLFLTNTATSGHITTQAPSSFNAVINTFDVLRANLTDALPTLACVQAVSNFSRVLVNDHSSNAAIGVLQAGEPGVSTGNVIIGNNYLGTGGASMARRNTSVGAFFTRYGQSTLEHVSVSAAGALSSRMSVNSSGVWTVNGDFLPNANNTLDLGSNALKFAEIYGTAIFSGDVTFENGYSWTESYKAGVKTPGMAMTNTRGTVVLFVDGRGNVYANRYRDLSELKRAA